MYNNFPVRPRFAKKEGSRRVISTKLGKGGWGGGEGDVGIFLCSISFLLIEALLYHEECHSKGSPSFTTTPELDCT